MANVLLGEGREGRVSTSISKGRLVVNETYHDTVIMDDPLATRADVLNVADVPIPYVTPSPTDMGICTNVDAVRNPQKITHWALTITYSSNVEDNSGSGGNPTTDPVTWVPTRETYLEPFEEVLMRDLDDREFVNGAGVPFESSSSTPRDNLRYDFFQFDPITVTDEQIATWNNSMNDAVYLSFYEKHTLLLKIRKSVVGYYFGRNLRLTEFSLYYKESNWNDKYANYGNSFRHSGKVWPYVYKDSPNVVHKGPLGTKDYTLGVGMDDRGGLPTGDNTATVANCVESVTIGGVTTVYAKPPTTPKLYFLERRNFKELDFASVLRLAA